MDKRFPLEICLKILRYRINGDVSSLWKIYSASDAEMFINKKSPIVELIIKNNIGEGVIIPKKNPIKPHILTIVISWVAGWIFAQTDDYRVALMIGVSYLVMMKLCVKVE